MADTEIKVFDNRHDAADALRGLHDQGVPNSAITVMSSEPLHLGTKGRPKSRIGGFAIAGAFLGAAFAIALTVSTSRRVGLVTGGMPIVTPWAFGIIVFELIALGAILATLVRMIFEAKLARRSKLTAYNEAVAEGRVVLAVHSSDDAQVEAARRIFGNGLKK